MERSAPLGLSVSLRESPSRRPSAHGRYLRVARRGGGTRAAVAPRDLSVTRARAGSMDGWMDGWVDGAHMVRAPCSAVTWRHEVRSR